LPLPRTTTTVPRPSISLSSLDHSDDVVCALDNALCIVYCNPAWDRFAAQNGGTTCRSSKIIGTPLFQCISESLTRFFRTAFDVVLESGDPFEFDYECSSAQTYRIFRMRILPISGPASLLLVHSLRVEKPHDRPSLPPDDARYRSPAGFIVMCCHCRRTKRVAEAGAWDWVPDYVAGVPPRVSTGMCSTCYAYFYSEIYAQRAASSRK
jgi:hypothetical protein